MNWLNDLLYTHSALQAVVVISIICSLGLALGKIQVRGVSLGVAFVFFVGIFGGNLGLNLNKDMLMYAESFGLILFVYTLGLNVGPSFFPSLKHGGMALNMWSIAVILLGTVFAIALTAVLPINISDITGILCGATTNTPALGAAQQALKHMGNNTENVALACAVTYPLGVLGMIIALIIIRKLARQTINSTKQDKADEDTTYIGQYVVINPAIYGKTVAEVSKMSHLHFIISRIWRENKAIIPISDTIIEANDNIIVVTQIGEEEVIEMLFGKKIDKNWNKENIDWNRIDNSIEAGEILVTKPELNGKSLGALQLRHNYGVNVSRVLRGDVRLLATENLRICFGDRIAVVGSHKSITKAQNFLGNSIKTLKEPNLAVILIGMIIGLAIGTIPFSLPGMETPVKLGIAGGPIIAGILVGAFGTRFHLVTYTTRSVSLMLRKLGLSLYLACLGLEAGQNFFNVVVRPEGLLWIFVGFIITLLPVIVIGIIAVKTKKYDFGTICGILCGSMANPMALNYANDTVNNDNPSVSYTTVYPLAMLIRVIIAQAIIIFLT